MYKCNAIVLLTLLQDMCPQLVQLLNGWKDVHLPWSQIVSDALVVCKWLKCAFCVWRQLYVELCGSTVTRYCSPMMQLKCSTCLGQYRWLLGLIDESGLWGLGPWACRWSLTASTGARIERRAPGPISSVHGKWVLLATGRSSWFWHGVGTCCSGSISVSTSWLSSAYLGPWLQSALVLTCLDF